MLLKSVNGILVRNGGFLIDCCCEADVCCYVFDDFEDCGTCSLPEGCSWNRVRNTWEVTATFTHKCGGIGEDVVQTFYSSGQTLLECYHYLGGETERLRLISGSGSEHVHAYSTSFGCDDIPPCTFSSGIDTGLRVISDEPHCAVGYLWDIKNYLLAGGRLESESQYAEPMIGELINIIVLNGCAGSIVTGPPDEELECVWNINANCTGVRMDALITQNWLAFDACDTLDFIPSTFEIDLTVQNKLEEVVAC